VYLLLRQVIDTLPRKEAIEITVAGSDDAIMINIENGTGLTLLAGDNLHGEQEQALLQWLRAQVLVVPGKVVLRMPRLAAC